MAERAIWQQALQLRLLFPYVFEHMLQLCSELTFHDRDTLTQLLNEVYADKKDSDERKSDIDSEGVFLEIKRNGVRASRARKTARGCLFHPRVSSAE